MSTLTATLQAFFTTYLSGQKAASPHTIRAYRDTWRMLLTYLHDTTGTRPADIEFTDLGAEAITGFLQHLETQRHNSVRTRNARLAAIHSLFSYAAYRHPEHAEVIARVLAIQTKNTHSTILTYLTDPEVDALLNGPDRSTRIGRRDHVILLTLITTGLRVGELIALSQRDLHLSRPAHLRVHGKGRKDRITPLNPATATTLRRWNAESPAHHGHNRVFTAQGKTMSISTDAIAARIRVHHDGSHDVSDPGRQERHPTHAAAHDCDADARRRDRHHHHRALARPRIHRVHPALSTRRPRPETTSTQPARSAVHTHDTTLQAR